jgi:hypothetical protein
MVNDESGLSLTVRFLFEFSILKIKSKNKRAVYFTKLNL